MLRDETFAYDSRGRLELYTVSGTHAPLDPQGKQIRSQIFGFDALDNIVNVETGFAGGSNTAVYEYTGQDPTQLSAVRNSHADYPADIELDYDGDGNLILDNMGRSLRYDALGRLLAVSAADGSAVADYGYDAQDSLVRSTEAGLQEQRFYREGRLSNQLQGAQQRTFIGSAESLLRVITSGAVDGVVHRQCRVIRLGFNSCPRDREIDQVPWLLRHFGVKSRANLAIPIGNLNIQISQEHRNGQQPFRQARKDILDQRRIQFVCLRNTGPVPFDS